MPAPITVMLLSVLLVMGFLLVTGGNTHKKYRSWRIVCLTLKKLTRRPVNRIRSGQVIAMVSTVTIISSIARAGIGTPVEVPAGSL